MSKKQIIGWSIKVICAYPPFRPNLNYIGLIPETVLNSAAEREFEMLCSNVLLSILNPDNRQIEGYLLRHGMTRISCHLRLRVGIAPGRT